jgi:mannose-1-phosphate guanylyltransferase/phosphomannomutase
VVDYANGSSSLVFPTLFTQLGISATELNSHPNPRKCSRTTEERAQAIVQLSAIVRSLNADIGFRVNPAAEKLTVIDETGTPLDDQTLLLLVSELFMETYGPNKIAVPVMASMAIEEIAEKYGVEVVRVGNDHQAMMNIRRSGEVSFVGGTRGGFIFPGFQAGGDAMFAMVRILEMMARTRTCFGPLHDKYEHFIRQTASVPCPWSKKGTVMRRLITASHEKERQLIDGVRIFEDDGWVLVTPDRLKASFNIMAESTSKAVTNKLVNRYREVVKDSQEN